MTWTLTVANDAEKNLRRVPRRDRQRLIRALREMQDDPFSGDVAQLRAQSVGYRRRVGSYRILFDVDASSVDAG
jgi:mRNA-degrading endonuclease RelE of RelBE toxin-antitoxin system